MEELIKDLLFGLIGTPIIAAVVMLFIREGKIRNILTYAFAAIIAIGSIILVATNIGATYKEIAVPDITLEITHFLGIALSVVIAGVIIGFGIKYKNKFAIILAVIQLLASLYVEIFIEGGAAPKSTSCLYIDSLTVLMVFIIGVIGTGIIVYALGYMTDHNKHLAPEETDRSNNFFALMFLFLSAMFIIVFSNNMIWMFAGWEVTTLCSFLLIGYTKTDEAIKNSFRQINMNLLGGIAFAAAMFLSATQLQTLEFNTFVTTGLTSQALISLPACLFAFAAITKAAQMPFQSWLLGAMVAPTPTSALLHSSTMVKAGVFLLIKLSPIFFTCIAPQLMVMLVGGVSFLLCSFMAISQTNAKRVLAYSTIANLGLITACAGVGSPEAIWAAMFLMLFHACAKSLLFLCVGTAEHHIGSRDIEDMDGLFRRMPILARFMMVGMMAMFIAPFGMLISKWAALVSFIDSGQIVLILILAFGSAATFMFWAKWLGKLAGIVAHEKNIEKTVHTSEWIGQMVMVVLVILGILAMPVISEAIIMPYILDVFSAFGQYGIYYVVSLQYVGMSNLFISLISASVMVLVLFIGSGKANKKNQADIYLAGAGINSEKRQYLGSLQTKTEATSRNMYLDKYFGEKRITPIGNTVNIIIMIASALFAVLSCMGMM
ncbi:MAG: proton-conducting transporter membrane subunit [Coriobacteriia bacterium]|nr:proton-conducting transporter membrane subunit [Coriobacteriia bacterium]